MRSIEDQLRDERTNDGRRTSAEWIKLIDEMKEEGLVFSVAVSLSGSNMVLEDTAKNGETKLHMTREMLVDYAINRFLQLVGQTDFAKDFLKRFGDAASQESEKHPNGRTDLFLLEMRIKDFIIERRQTGELYDLELSLRAYRVYLPADSEMLGIHIEEVVELLKELADTQKMRVSFQDSASGVIDSAK